MQLKEGFILRTVAGETVVVPSGEALNLNMMITLNETGKFIWKLLENGIEKEAIVDAIMKEYDVQDRAMVENDVNTFINKLSGDNILE